MKHIKIWVWVEKRISESNSGGKFDVAPGLLPVWTQTEQNRTEAEPKRTQTEPKPVQGRAREPHAGRPRERPREAQRGPERPRDGPESPESLQNQSKVLILLKFLLT